MYQTYLATDLLSSGKREKGAKSQKFNQINICQSRVFAAFSCTLGAFGHFKKSCTDGDTDSQTERPFICFEMFIF